MRGLYIHLPFCKSKCPYCGFYSESATDDELINSYIETLINELRANDDNDFDTIYIGGGTPSALHSKMLDKLLSGIMGVIKYNGKEFTIEANPESVSADFISFINNSAVSRVSLGVQSLDDNVLKILGRIHGSSTAISAVSLLKNTKADINLDMIFDLPDVDKNIIFGTADKIIELNPAHISAYSYSPEDRQYLCGFDDDETQFDDIRQKLESSGYMKYEVSNFAKKGKESKHNMIYWQMGEYIGIGASAHSMIHRGGKRIRYSRPASIVEYIKNFSNYALYEELEHDDMIVESIIFGLRMTKGVNLSEIEKMFGKISQNLLKKIDSEILRGLLIWDSDYLKTTTRGALVLDSLSVSLLDA